MLKITSPIYKNPTPAVLTVCTKETESARVREEIVSLSSCNFIVQHIIHFYSQQDNPYERILAKEFMNWVENSKFIAIFQELVMNGEERYNVIFIIGHFQSLL